MGLRLLAYAILKLTFIQLLIEIRVASSRAVRLDSNISKIKEVNWRKKYCMADDSELSALPSKMKLFTSFCVLELNVCDPSYVNCIQKNLSLESAAKT